MRMRVLGVLMIGLVVAPVQGAGEVSYAAMAPFAAYAIKDVAEEVALARSAAPPSISGDADVQVLGSKGYETVAHGHNGFVCMVWRSWAAEFPNREFWNPRLRAPICLNPAAVKTVLPTYLERTQWGLSGVSKAQMVERTRQAVQAHRYPIPETGAMAYMQSKQGMLGDQAGHWHPHVMFFMPRIELASWGANLEGSVMFGAQGDPDPVTTCFLPVQKWSDGTPDVPEAHVSQ